MKNKGKEMMKAREKQGCANKTGPKFYLVKLEKATFNLNAAPK